jgi:hypothetical protein
MTGYPFLFDLGVPIEACLDDVMHTKMLGTLEREYEQFINEICRPRQMVPTINQRCDVFPFTSQQENISRIGTKLSGKFIEY